MGGDEIASLGVVAAHVLVCASAVSNADALVVRCSAGWGWLLSFRCVGMGCLGEWIVLILDKKSTRQNIGLQR